MEGKQGKRRRGEGDEGKRRRRWRARIRRGGEGAQKMEAQTI